VGLISIKLPGLCKSEWIADPKAIAALIAKKYLYSFQISFSDETTTASGFQRLAAALNTPKNDK